MKKTFFFSVTFFYIALALFETSLLSCDSTPKNAHTIIENSSNKTELNKVINHYKSQGETQKLKATYVLLKSMPEHFHYDSEARQRYHNIFEKVGSQRKIKDFAFAWDSVSIKLGFHFSNKVSKTQDIQMLKADELIKHIDAAFNAWNYPWAKGLTFDEFCEYILPYKLLNEKPDFWNSRVQQEYHWVLDSMKKNEDPYDACIVVNNHIKTFFKFVKFPTVWDVNYGELNSIKAGACYHATQYAAYIMRAMGLPVVMDFTPYWGNLNGGHDWNALIYNGKPIPFVGGESNPGYTKIDLAFQRKRAKIFRRTYSARMNKLKGLTAKDYYIPTFLKSIHVEDVTKEYIPVSNITAQLNGVFPDAQYALLCVFNEQKWTPIYWGEVDTQQQKVTFENMGREILYLPMYTELGSLIPAGKPFVVTKAGSVDSIACDVTQKTNLVIRKKGYHGPNITKGNTYELYYWNSQWVSLGKVTAETDSLLYRNAPKDALFWIRSSDKSTKERIFTYKDNKQIWW